MLSRLPTPIAFDLFLRIGIAASRQPRSRHLHSSTPRLVHDSDMSQNVETGAQSRRPKKLICTQEPTVTARSPAQCAAPRGTQKELQANHHVAQQLHPATLKLHPTL